MTPMTSDASICWSEVSGWDILIEVITDPPIAEHRVWLQLTFPDLESPITVILTADEARQISAGLALAATSADRAIA